MKTALLPVSIAALVLAALASTRATARTEAADESSAEAPKGTLIAVGGGGDIDELLRLFLETAGGTTASIVVIPTAGGRERYDQDWSGLGRLRAVGAQNLLVLHTTDPKVADTEAFVEPLKAADGVWISGGRQWRLVDAYLGTRVQSELVALHQRGGVIGGSSAGATILGSYLARGDSKTNTIMMGDHEVGFGLIPNVAIDQHVLARNRQFDLLEIVNARPELLGIGIDENTAIVVHDGEFTVAGKSYVVIYDQEKSIDSGGSFYFLAPGDRFRLEDRRALRGDRALERVVDESWDERGR